jgi:hypothetical protein
MCGNAHAVGLSEEVQVKKCALLFFSVAIVSALAMPAYAAAPQPGTTGIKSDQALVFTVKAPTPAPTIVAANAAKATKKAEAVKPAAKPAKAKKAKKAKADKKAEAKKAKVAKKAEDAGAKKVAADKKPNDRPRAVVEPVKKV